MSELKKLKTAAPFPQLDSRTHPRRRRQGEERETRKGTKSTRVIVYKGLRT